MRPKTTSVRLDEFDLWLKGAVNRPARGTGARPERSLALGAAALTWTAAITTGVPGNELRQQTETSLN